MCSTTNHNTKQILEDQMYVCTVCVVIMKFDK